MKVFLALLALVFLGSCGDRGEGKFTAAVAGVENPPGVPPPPPPPPPGPNPFDDSRLTTYRITLAPSDWDAIVADPHDNTWRRCTVEWEGEVFADVAIRPAGNRSRIPGNPKPSFRLEFDEFVADREFHKFSGLKMDSMIHDETMMRCRLEYPVFAARGVPAPQYVHCRMVVNGQYKGLYGVEERVGKEFVRKRFGRPVEQLYEWRSSAGDLRWFGAEPVTMYVPDMWRPDIEELPPGAEGVRDLCYALNNDLVLLPPLFDIDSFLNYIAVETVMGEGDLYVAGHDGLRTANIRLYKSPVSGKYLILPWDCDQGFWRPETGITHAFENRILTRNLILWNPDNMAKYRQILRELMAGPFETARMHRRVDEIFAQIRDAAREDPLKPFDNDEFEYEVGAIKEYIAERNLAFQSQLGP